MPTAEDAARYLDARSLAPRYGVSYETLLAWARRGWVPCLRAGRGRPVLFDPDAVAVALCRRGALEAAR